MDSARRLLGGNRLSFLEPLNFHIRLLWSNCRSNPSQVINQWFEGDRSWDVVSAHVKNCCSGYRFGHPYSPPPESRLSTNRRSRGQIPGDAFFFRQEGSRHQKTT